MATAKFFDESLEQSQIKAEIVAKYFWVWAKIISPYSARIGYIDLFAGPGRYKDGSLSTPIRVLEQAVKDDVLSKKLVAMFNDMNSNHATTLQRAIETMPDYEKLVHHPKVYNNEVGSEIVNSFESMRLIPSLLFVDPWGYKGLSLRLVNSVLRNWGCDCIFFFNYNRISMGISNPLVSDHIDALFGEERGKSLRNRINGLSPFAREMTIVNELSLALKELGGKFVLPFCFKNARGERTSHHLVFVSKKVRGYEIMKEIMANYSSEKPQGVPSFSYNPVMDNRLQILFEFSRPLDELGGMLLETFSGKTLTMLEIYERHHVDRPYIKKNYKAVLNLLESDGKISVIPPADERRMRNGERTFADSAKVTFPND